MYNTLEQLAAAAADRPMHEVVIADEAALTDASPETIFETMRARWRVMRQTRRARAKRAQIAPDGAQRRRCAI